jgi:hypothetical protein
LGEIGRRSAPQNKIENEVEVEGGCGCAAQKEVEVRNKLPTQTENCKLAAPAAKTAN